MLPQPRAQLLVTGKLEVANLYLPPNPALIGERIAIVGGELAKEDLWMLPELFGVELPENWQREGFPRGVIGSAVLRGWVKCAVNGKVVRQERPGNKSPFRKLKGLSGPYGWVLRQPSVTKLPRVRSGIRVIRAGYYDQPVVQKHIVWYAQTYGADKLTAEQRAGLPGWRQKWEGKVSNGKGTEKSNGTSPD